MKDDLVKISKFLSYILRHKPDAIALDISIDGWVKIDELISAAKKDGWPIDEEIINEVVKSNSKQRFSFSDDGLYVRANQGHSIEIELGLKPQIPPDILFHGTVEKFVANINNEGLKKMKRHHVHLYTNKNDACNVGSRRGRPVIFSVDSKSMFEDGLSFFLSKNGVWLTGYVCPKYIKREE